MARRASAVRKESWKKARMRALVRDDFHCQACKLELCPNPCPETRLRYLHVHHLKARSQGGTHALDNLVTLCREHHQVIHPWMKKILVCRYPRREYPFREL